MDMVSKLIVIIILQFIYTYISNDHIVQFKYIQFCQLNLNKALKRIDKESAFCLKQWEALRKNEFCFVFYCTQKTIQH